MSKNSTQKLNNNQRKGLYLSEGLELSDEAVRVGLLGGTFNPPHLGHIWLGETFSATLKLSKIVLMPTFTPPHKINPELAAPRHRVEMCKLITDSNKLFEVSTLEIERGELGAVSFTVDTIEALAEQSPYIQIFLLVGADMFTTIRSWKSSERILKKAVICTLPRDGIGFDELVDYGKKLENSGGKVVVIDALEQNISSTNIRKMVQKGEDISEYVSKNVSDYIKSNGLYVKNSSDELSSDTKLSKGDGLAEKIPAFTNIVKGRLSEKRFKHSVNVAEKAAALAERYGANKDKAYAAGILHDIFKESSRQTQLQIFEDFDIITDSLCLNPCLSNGEKGCEPYLHAFSGAAFVSCVLKLEDSEIIDAIKYHTTGRANMSLLEKVVFVADYISDDRTYPDVEMPRALAFENLDKTILYCLSYTICDCIKKGDLVHPKSFEAYNYFVNKKN